MSRTNFFKKYSKTYLILIAGFIFFVGLFSTTSAEAAWLTGWANRRAITIDNTAGSALTNYQIPLDTTNSIYNESGLIGSWHFNEGSGTGAQDSSGNYNYGTLVNSPTWTAAGSCKFGNCLSFDGWDDYVSVPDSSLWNLKDDFSISMWVRHTGVGQAYISQGQNDANSWQLLVGGGGNLRFVVYSGGGIVLNYELSNEGQNDGFWHLVTYVHTSSAHYMYVDGVYRAPNVDQTIGNPTYDFSGPLYFGRTPWTSPYYLNGSLDEIRIYNRALSVSEISDLYNGTKARLDYGDLRFTNEDGSTLIDHWQESDKKSWVEVPSISAASQKTIYMYYGKSDATSVSSGANTFLLYDNFDTFDTGKWSYANGTPTASNSILSIPSNGVLSSINTYGTNTSITWRASLVPTAYGIIGYANVAANTYEAHYANYPTSSIFNAINRNGNTSSQVTGNIGAFTGYNLFTVKRNASTDARFNINNGAETTLSSYLVTSSLSAHIWGQSQTVTADWVFVRNYNVNEPTASIYAEQQNLTYSLRRAITIDNTSGNSLYDYQIPIDLTNSIYNNAGLVGSWHLNDGYGIYAYDSSGDHQMGTWSGTSSYWTSDAKAGTGGTFNGSDTGLSAGTWFNHQQFTISLWVKPGTTQQAYADLFDNNHSGTQNFVFQQNATSVNQYMFATLHPSGTCQTSYFNLTASTWQYVTAVRDARSVKVYINGVETASGTASCQLPVNYVSTNLYFGRHATLGRYWNGQMDEIRAYSRALSSSEISDLYNASKTKLDYSDLRFSDNTLYNDQNWTTSYSYWLESDKKAWVKIPSVAASTQKTIYMYYGNANATNQSNISNTFIFGDDFENGVIDDEKWPVKDLTGFSELGGYLNGSNTTGYLHSNIAFTGNYIQEVLHKRISQTGNGYMSTGFWGSTSNGYGTLLHPTNLWYNRSDGTWNNGTAIYTSDDWVRTKTVAIGSGSYTQVGGLINFTHAYSNSGLSAEYVRLGRRYDSDAYNNQGYSGKWDWVFVRKYTSVEPTTSIYAEQQNLTYSLRRAITIDNTVNASTLYDYQVPVDISTTIYDKRGLFSSWHMDEFSGIVMGDSSGNGYNGTFANNLMWTSGKYGGGLYFNSNSVALGTYDVSPQGAPFSVFAWVKTTQSNSGTVCGSAGSIFSKRTGTNTFCLGVGGTTNANSVGVANWSGTGDVVGTVTINDNNWHYVGFSWNGSVVSLYIDGILNKTQAISFGTQSIANGNSLGAFDSGTARPYVGSLDEVETYSRILSPLEINERYNASKTKLNYGDIRFSDSTSYNDQNWTTSYSYWLESDKKAWVKIPSIAASTQKTIYMYYGNATATGPSPLGKSVNGTITYTDSSGLNPRSSPSYAGGYTVHTFTSGTSVFSPNLPRNADVLVVGGGGGGGTPGANYCGGGGAGGLIYKQSHLIDSGFGYLIEIGSGGAAATNGNNSIFGGLTAYGGGAGYCAAYYSPGIAGGSGGGGTPTNSVGGAAYVGQGNIGGNSSSANPGGSDSGAGGGGGAGGKGNHIGSFPFTNSPAEGGQGLNISISGVASWYAAGGTGSGWYPNAGANGIGGSVYGGHRDGTANTGSGGGGSEVYHVGGVGGSGGSGIVIVRYKTPTVTEPTTSVYSEQNNVTFANQVSISIDNTSGGVLYDYQIPVDLTSAVYDNTGLVGSWHLDEVVGVSTPDSSGNFNNGTLVNGPTWMPVSSCKYGSCLGFNGSSNYVDILNSTLFDVANVTMSAWVYSSNFTQNGFIFEKGSVNSQYACFFESGYITFRTVNSSSVSDDLDVSVSVISNGNWHHLACVYDGSTKKIYVDGSEVGSKSYTQTLRTGQSGQRIGAYGGGTPSYYFNGRIDEVRVYNRGLSPK